MTWTDDLANDPELIRGFVEESREHLQVLGDRLLELEAGTCDSELIHAIFRSIHTIKGCSRSFGFEQIGELSHAAENLLDALRGDRIKPSAEIAEGLIEACDLLAQLVDEVAEGCVDDEGHADDVAKIIRRLAELGGGGRPETSFQDAHQKANGESSDSRPSDRSTNALDESPPDGNQENDSVPKTESWPEPGTGLDKEFVKQFVIEARESLDTLETALLTLESTPADGESLNAVFRAVHSLKGTADYVGLRQIKTLSHRLENVLDLARSKKLEFTGEVIDVVFEAADALKTMVDELHPDAESPCDCSELLNRLDDIAQGANASLTPSCLDPENASRSELKEEPSTDRQSSLPTVFVQTAQQHLESLEKCLRRVVEGQSLSDVDEMVTRSVQTLHRAVEYYGLSDFKTVLEELERQVATLKRPCDSPMEAIVDEIRATVDQFRRMMRVGEEKSGAGPMPPSDDRETDTSDGPTRETKTLQTEGGPSGDKGRSKQKGQAVPKSAATMRVDQQKLDDYVNLAGELVIARNALMHVFREFQQGTGRLRDLKEAVSRINRITTELQNNAMSMRMVPVSTVFQRFPRIVRDIAKNQGKQIELQVYGGETELDKQLAEALADPLVHLVRNAADHGIEMPEERRQAGKSPVGSIVLKAGREGNFMVIDIIDDGAGIDVQRLKEKAVEKGILSSEQAESLPREQAMNLLFEAGLSTAKQVTDISGRGVGMDVVRTNIAKLGGSVTVQSEEGTGTHFRIQLPLTLAVTSGVLVEAAGRTYALPIETVSETVKVSVDRIRKLNGQNAISLRGEVVPLRSLREVLELKTGDDADGSGGLPTDRTNRVPIVVTHAHGTKFGIVVDQLKGQQEIVVKPLPNYLASLPGLGGVTIMGDGSIVLILDPMKLGVSPSGKPTAQAS